VKTTTNVPFGTQEWRLQRTVRNTQAGETGRLPATTEQSVLF
jgi:hypothetical protein